MMLEGSNASTALSWVREDLDNCLEVIRDSLEVYADERSRRSQLKTAQEKLEQLNLTFVTMAQRGATLLTDEMIAVGGNMLNNSDANIDESLSALSDAVVVLPSYLDRLQAGHDDLPLLLLPTLNELRASYDESLLSEGTLFAPELDITIAEIRNEPEEPVSINEWPAFARRVRSQYQSGLLSWLKEQSKQDMVKPLHQVCVSLYSRIQRRSLRRLWWIAAGVMEGLQEGAIDNDLPLRRVFARLDLCLKGMVEQGQDGPPEDSLTALSRALLFHVAQARTGCTTVDRLRDLFRLEEIIPDRDALLRARGAVTGRDARLFYSIGEAIREEMVSIKDSLDMELRTGRIDAESRTAIVASLIQLSDTLQMLNLPVPAVALQELLPTLELTREVENFELDSPLLNLAQQLLEVEAVLQKHIQHLGEPVDESEDSGSIALSRHEQRQILSVMLHEAVATLHQAQEGIRERLEGEPGADYVTPLRQISGAMHMAGQMEVSKLTEKLERALNAALVGAGAKQEEPGVAVLLLTDAVAALELYLTGCRDGQRNSLRFLDIMQDRLEGMPEATSAGDAMAGTVVSLPKQREEQVPEPAVSRQPTPAAPAGDELPSPIDTDMQDIFVEEFDGVDAQLRAALQAWSKDPAQHKPLEDIRRGFHTLKGSGRMVGAKELGEFAWRIENMLNRVLESKVEQSPQAIEVVRMGIAALPLLRGRMLQEPNELNATGVKRLAEFARQLSGGELPNLDDLAGVIPESVLTGTPAAPEPAQPESAKAAGSEAEAPPATHAAVTEGESAATVPPGAQEEGPDPTLVQLMVGEVRQYLDALEPFVAAVETGAPVKVTTDQVRTAHSLVGTLSLAPAGDEPELARALESYLQAQAWANQLPGTGASDILRACLQRIEGRLAILEGRADSASYPSKATELISQLIELRKNVKAGDAATAAQPADEAQEQAAQHPQEEAAPEAGESREAAAESAPQEPGAEDREVEAEAADQGIEAEARQASTPPTESVAADEDAVAGEHDERDGLDREILGIFLDESTEVLERCDTILNTWRDKLNDKKLVQNLQREIHTFKGGARMAGLEPLGNLSHAMETLLERIAAGGVPATVAAVQALEEGCDCLNLWTEMLQEGRIPQDDGALRRFKRKVELLISGPVEFQAEPVPTTLVPESPEPVKEVDSAEPISTEPPEIQPGAAASVETHDGDIPAVPSIAPSPTEIDKLDDLAQGLREITERAPGEEDAPVGAQIRVAADLMDSLVNYSGEISIYRARLEEQLSTVRFNLKEVDQTVARLNDQLRKMEMETEAHMLSRYHHASSKSSSEFDPLELDRFSNIQQLSRALSETVSDLLSLHEMLDDSVRQAESLLSSQSRVSSDLQDGLMQTRMTPFGSAAPRLRRLVRSAAAETGKNARLQLLVGGTSDRLDRNVLERITAPMEHMLRNAVVHGLESPEQRKKAGKPEEGVITVTVSAEATEFVIRVQDDGAGLDLDAIRKRAIERGLLGKGDNPSARQLARFILESGFSTTDKVTELAGRGVGMDVVNSEIKQIGGNLEIAAEPGKGARFTVRIPFSLAVMQAIGVSVGGHPYLVPLNSVAGVGRMTPSDYSKLIKREDPTYEFAGEQYPLIEMGPLLGMKPDPMDSDNVTLLMIDTGEQRAAFRVSSLRGHQEVVVKPIGPQVSSIPGILGATISGDGRVVIILDVGPLIRHGAGRAVALAELPKEKSEDVRPPLVMVIDDSITMRKVTTRVLENHALKVMSAKDGVDAIEKLNDAVPDLILLDIEMPRMDGYELAEHIRSDSRLRKIPIIMVTSRAGQKHRKRARKIGADGYLTKPYQEAELIEQVGDLLQRNLTRRGD